MNIAAVLVVIRGGAILARGVAILVEVAAGIVIALLVAVAVRTRVRVRVATRICRNCSSGRNTCSTAIHAAVVRASWNASVA